MKTEDNSSRIVFLDYLRLIACFMVMLIHSIEPFYFDLSGNLSISSKADAIWVSILDSAARVSVPLFVMASSYLLFPLNRPTGEFFKRRLSKVLIPFFFWSAAYTWRFGGNWSEMAFNFPLTAGHLWFVPMLVGMYILIPLISPWAQKASRREVLSWIGLWAITTTFPFVRRLCQSMLGDPSFGAIPYLYGESPWNHFGTFHYVSGFFGYLLIGYYFRRFVSELSWAKTLAFAVPLWIFGMAVMAGGFYAAIPSDGGYPVLKPYAAAVILETSIEYCGLGVAAATVAVFMIIRKFTADGAFYKKIIVPSSAASYGTYLLHMMILLPIISLLKGRLPTPLCMFVTASATFVLSTLASALIRKIPRVGKYIAG